ncbi:putative flippase GtrA [Allocatelliglobosispora scoriae]|uniref:Putative flippase GtrA n=1 Tax=Allocatelliglobosispora scoriae TaxID=643052 RepID=A0A841C0B7_9ACTN|nr:GtrA family protein [Allocatelliglobosispora scoriae]MBB5873296.1 putative flippase GtrA [Allocatelliglobosispora scoriae]
MSLIQRGYGLLRQNLQRLARFGVVGMIGLVADVGLFNLLRYAGGEGPLYNQPLTAKVISTSLGIVVSWLGHRYWTFSEKRRTAAHREFVVFVVVCLIGLGITVGTLAVSHYVLGFTGVLADNIAANVVGLGLATAFRFWAMNAHVFTEVRPPATDEALATSSR